MNASPWRRRRLAAVGVAAVTALAVATGCSASNSEAGGKITLTVDVFGNFGYSEAGLYKEFEKSHPNIKIKERGTGMELSDYDDRLTQWLAAGSGAGDVVSLEEGILIRFKAQPKNFVNLFEHGADKLQGNFLTWKWQQGLSADGTQLIGLGTDVGSLAMCYRPDLFEQAGLPTDREQVGKLWPTWDKYVATGEKFAAAGKAGKVKAKFLDSATNTYNAILMQHAGQSTNQTYFNQENEFVMASNPAVKQAWETTLKMVDSGLSANLRSFSDQWNTGFKSGAFATIACPAWMLGYIQGQAGDAGKGKWDVATIPGGGGNWGGSFLAVPKQSKHPKEAAELVKFLTSPESQLKVFQALNNLPSSPKALDSPELKDFTNEYFNNAPVGVIFGAGARELAPVYLGPKNQPVRDEVENALRAVEQGQLAPGKAWDTAVANGGKVAS
ncbi:MAG: ABC transporter substrate-binding protein [Micromonosporaceae bacterium]